MGVRGSERLVGDFSERVLGMEKVSQKCERGKLRVGGILEIRKMSFLFIM